MPTTTAGKNDLLSGLNVNEIRLHSGDPGAAGGLNAISGATGSVTYAAASNGEREIDSPVTGIPIPSATTVSWFSLWEMPAGTLKAYKQFDQSEVYNAAGTATVTSAKFTLADAV